MRKSGWAESLFLAMLLAGGVARADCSARNQWPVTLANNTTADADQVMKNFNHIRDCGYFTGNVGVGTSSPATALEVQTSSSAYWLQGGGRNWGGSLTPLGALTITNTYPSGYDPLLLFRMATSAGTVKSAAAIDIRGENSWSEGNVSSQISGMNFILRDGADTLQTRMTISSTGNVGIGTMSPSSTLDVVANAGVAKVTIERTGSGANAGYLYNDGNLHLEANSTLWLNHDNSQSIVMAYGGGNVGIGMVPGSSYKLDVNGTIRSPNPLDPSDRRLKTDIKPLSSDVLAHVMALRPVTFRWKTPKDDGMAGLQMGLIAQEVEAVFPTAVITARDSPKTKSIKYNELTAVLIKAVQEQHAAMQEQRHEITALRAANAKLRADFAVVQLQVKQFTDLTMRLDRLERTRVAKIQ